MKRALFFLLNLAVYVAIVAGVLFGLPRFLSWYLHTPYPMAAITSGSMWPVLHTGDLVFIEGVGKGDLRIGDIVVWKNPSGFTIHRVVRLGENTLVTKGDANFTEDDPVKYEDVVGRTHQVWGKNARIPYLGHITMYASQR
ncbi:MAG: signal peptidase I [Patescibacteria group bacterium]